MASAGMAITITIETDNAVFDEDSNNQEVARILNQLAGEIEQNDCGGLRDINGNTVGCWSWK